MNMYKVHQSFSIKPFLNKYNLRNVRSFSEITVQEKNDVKTVTLCNTKTRNALSFNMLKELKDAVLNNSPNIRCIILKAKGNVFSSGHNLKEFIGNEKKDSHAAIFQSCSELMLGIPALPVPVIAQVNGVAAAAGCQLVASCDIAIASDKSTFLTPGANFGLFCSTPGIALVRNVPVKRAADMLLTGLPITAYEAMLSGLVSSVVPENELNSEVGRRVNAICHKSASVLALGKKFMYDQMTRSIQEAYRLGGDIMVENVSMPDGQEGIKSFAEKRKPIWPSHLKP